MVKTNTLTSTGGKAKPFRVITMAGIESRIPMIVQKAEDLMCLGNMDAVISVLRYFEWDLRKVEENWFANMDTLRVKIGLDFDTSLKTKYPEISSALPDRNNNTCPVMYVEFEPDDPDYKAVSLTCGHQFSAESWRYYLREKVESMGKMCVFTKCQQARCNCVVPHSMFLEFC